jgi:hypothetical protein
MQSEAEPNTPNPHTGRETGLDNFSRGLSETTHRGPASGTHRDVRARPTHGRVALAKGYALLGVCSAPHQYSLIFRRPSVTQTNALTAVSSVYSDADHAGDVGMHVDLCFAGVGMHVLRHGVPMLLGDPQGSPIIKGTTSC